MGAINTVQIIFIIGTYLVAAIPFGVVVSRVFSGVDVRGQGSGNTGATNVARLMGKKWGFTVLVMDALKGFVVVSLAKHVGDVWFCNFIAVLAVLAHCYPIYLRFKGGKGVATALGVLAALSAPIMVGSLVVFALGFGLSKRISVGSLSASLAAPFAATVLGGNLLIPTAWFLATIIWWKHKENIKRLAVGLEPKFF